MHPELRIPISTPEQCTEKLQRRKPILESITPQFANQNEIRSKKNQAEPIVTLVCDEKDLSAKSPITANEHSNSGKGKEISENGRLTKIGIIIPLTEMKENNGKALTYAEIRERAQKADELGFDSLWVNDHLFQRFPGKDTVGFREAWTTLSALAEATNNIHLGTYVLCTSFRNPAMLAKMADTLEDVSNGRLIVGLGAGWHKPEFEAFGFPYDHLASRFEEALEIIVPLLRDGNVNFTGKYYQAKDCELKPHATSREGGPPIMIGSFGPQMLDITARYAQSWNMNWLGPEDQVPGRILAVEKACHAVHRDPKTLEITGGVTLAFPELGTLPSWMTSRDQYLSGTSEQIADGFRKYASRGISHIMCSYFPNTPEALTNVGEALEVFRSEN